MKNVHREAHGLVGRKRAKHCQPVARPIQTSADANTLLMLPILESAPWSKLKSLAPDSLASRYSWDPLETCISASTAFMRLLA